MTVQVFADLEAVSRAAAELVVVEARRAVDASGRFSLALSGGSTPRRTYELLAGPPFREQAPWAQTHIFWGDERCVPPSDPRSNDRMARQALLDHVPIPRDQVHPVRGDLEPRKAADDYQAVLQRFFGGGPPRFDLVLLGLGENGHTASLFPGTPVLTEQTRWAAEVYVAEQDLYRVTLTAPCLNQAATVAFVVSGAAKTDVLRDVLEGPRRPNELPAQLIRPVKGNLLWLVDRPAAGRLKSSG